MSRLEAVELSLDELEAIRLADLDGHYQDGAAKEMGVSRATFGRIVETARRKIAEALVQGKALKIGGGVVSWAGPRRFECEACHDEWSLPLGAGPPEACPSCGSDAFRRTDPGPLAGPVARPVRSPRPSSRR
jgi:predicted DNA-binding protein (UPF0251 family)